MVNVTMLVWCIVNVVNTLTINCSIKFLSSKLIINFNWDSVEPGEPRVGLSKLMSAMLE